MPNAIGYGCVALETDSTRIEYQGFFVYEECVKLADKAIEAVREAYLTAPQRREPTENQLQGGLLSGLITMILMEAVGLPNSAMAFVGAVHARWGYRYFIVHGRRVGGGWVTRIEQVNVDNDRRMREYLRTRFGAGRH